MKQAFIFSKGIQKIPHLAHFLDELNVVAYSPFSPIKADIVLGWGLRPSTKKARVYAKKHGLPYVALEDGFVRSLDLGVKGAPPFSLVYDDVGIYYDTSRPSRLEQLILQGDFTTEDLAKGKEALDRIVQYNLSKYNHAKDFQYDKPKDKPIVLVIDQTFGDMAIQYGQADQQSFIKMLDCAIAENPDAEIWLKVHPDVISGKKQGHFSALPDIANLRVISEDCNPLSLLKIVDKVYCVTSHMGFEALMLNKPVVTFGVPWFAAWGLTDDRHPYAVQLAKSERRKVRSVLALFFAAYFQYTRYLNPFTHQRGTIFDVIEYLHQGKQYNDLLSGNLYCIGMSLWKKAVIKPFLNFPACHLHFISSLEKFKKLTLPEDAKILIWSYGKKEIIDFASFNKIPLLRMEDGFIRSVGLGSNLVAPLSLVIDDLGIYFNAESPSRLEKILQESDFSPQILKRATQLKEYLIKMRIDKYNVGKQSFFRPETRQKILLVTGQVEDDASIQYGSPEIRTNLALLKKVRTLNPNAYIIYKPHPDVVSGNRKGHIDTEQAKQYADQIVIESNILDCIEQSDEIHTMTSLSGFEALLRGKKVHCYGLPFYTGWGLTQDDITLPRRQRHLQLEELIAGVLLLYPLYFDSQHRQFTSAEQAIKILLMQKQNKKQNNLKQYWLKKQLAKAKQLYYALRF